MRSLRSVGAVLLLIAVCGVVNASGPAGTATILEGTARVVRDSAKHVLVPGVRLQAEDIVETDAGAFLQIELSDGTVLGLGPSTRVQLGPRLAREKLARPDKLYLLSGWLKVARPDAQAFSYASGGYDVSSQTGTTVALVGADSRLFVESGAARVVTRTRAGATPTASLGAGDFFVRADSDKWTVAKRPAADFVEKMPRPFRDTLPPLAARFADRPAQLKATGPIDYEDVADWLKAEPAVRRQFLTRWRARANDAPFRAGLVADMRFHSEWDRVLFPEKYLPKESQPATTSVQPGAGRQ